MLTPEDAGVWFRQYLQSRNSSKSRGSSSCQRCLPFRFSPAIERCVRLRSANVQDVVCNDDSLISFKRKVIRRWGEGKIRARGNIDTFYRLTFRVAWRQENFPIATLILPECSTSEAKRGEKVFPIGIFGKSFWYLVRLTRLPTTEVFLSISAFHVTSVIFRGLHYIPHLVSAFLWFIRDLAVIYSAAAVSRKRPFPETKFGTPLPRGSAPPLFPLRARGRRFDFLLIPESSSLLFFPSPGAHVTYLNF